MAVHSSILTWRIAWTEKPGRIHRVAELDTTDQLTHTHLSSLTTDDSGTGQS